MAGTPTPEEIEFYQADTPTPEEIEFYQSASGPSEVNPIRDLSADDLFSLSIQDPEHFHPVKALRQNKDLQSDPAIIQKVADVQDRIKERGFKFEDAPTIGEAATAVGSLIKGLGKQAWNYANALVGVPIASAIGEVTGDASRPGFTQELTQEGQRRVLENLTGTETALFGIGRSGQKLADKITRRVTASRTAEEKIKDLWDDVRLSEAEDKIIKGGSGFLIPSGVSEEVRKDLEMSGKPIREAEVAALAPGDPVSFWTFGKLFQGAGRLIPGKVAAGAEKIVAKADKAAEVVAGRGIQTAGVLTELGGKAVKIAGPAVGVTAGAIKGGPLGALAGLKTGEIAARTGRTVAEIGQKIAGAGEQIAGAVPVRSGVTQLAKDVAGSIPMAAYEISKGLAFDIGTAALTSESPQDTQSVGIGAFFGGLGAARRAGGRIISGQLVGPRAWGSDKPVPSSSQFPVLDQIHRNAYGALSPAQQTHLNAIRAFMKGTGMPMDAFMLPKEIPAAEQALLKAGFSPEQSKTFAEQEGFFTANLPGKDGKPSRVILMRNVDAAPHEVFHPIQDVLGESANQAIDRIVREDYSTQWENEGTRYASRIGPGDWREVILDATGTGLNYAKEKIAMTVANEYRAATGAEPQAGFVQDRVKATLGEIMDRAVQANPGVEPNSIAQHAWRDILSPQEATAVADSYLARELAAENFDVVFKSGNLENVSGLTGRLARIVAQLVSTLGGEPLSPGRVSQIGQVAPKFRVTEAVREAAQGIPVEPRQPSARPTIQPGPTTAPAPTDNAEQARVIAKSAPEIPVPGGTQTQREILGQVAEAIAQQAGVKVNYLSAPGEPAAATTSNREARRALIETFRTMPPEARALWEKNFFPERVIKLKGDKYQILGWSPEVFSANAHKLASKLVELGVADASPYPIAGDTLTPEGWQQLFKDTEQFVRNQMAGRTGAGEPLVVPKSVTDVGFFAPPPRGAASGLDQGRADFINMLFNFRLPDTARIQKGKLPLNIAAQEVSAATLPGRVEVPVIPRGKFEGPEAERQGIAGREIMEVNPLRQQIEAAAQAKGIAMPEFIEAIQRLNLENIKQLQVTPEQPQFRGNTLTLSAGFQPKKENPRAIKSAAIRFPSGKIYEGMFHSDAVTKGLQFETYNSPKEDFLNRLEDGFITHSGEFLNRTDAIERAKDLEQVPKDYPEYPLESFDFDQLRRFQPSAEPRAIKSAAVRDERGKIWEGFWHGDAEQNARVVGAEGPFTDGFTTHAGEFLNRSDALSRAKEIGQATEETARGLTTEELETSQLPKTVRDAALDAAATKFQPPKNAEQAEELVKSIAKMTPQEFGKWATDTKGFTTYAHAVGLKSATPEFVQLLKAASDSFGKRAEALIQTDIDSAMNVVAQQQFFREAWEAATGEGSAGFHFRQINPKYQPKFPIDRPAQIAEDAPVQLQPKKRVFQRAVERAEKKSALRNDPGAAYWIGPKGDVILAPEGHEQAAYELNTARDLDIDLDKLARDMDVGGVEKLYEVMGARKFLRAYNVDENTIGIEGPGRWETLPRAQRGAIEDAAVTKGLKVFYNNKEIDTAGLPDVGVTFQPPEFWDALKSPDSKTPTDPGYVYHASNQERLGDILRTKNILIFPPSYGTDQSTWPDKSTEKRSYWTTKANIAWHFAPEDGKPVLLRLPQSKDFKKESTGDYYATKKIPITSAEVWTESGWVPLEESIVKPPTSLPEVGAAKFQPPQLGDRLKVTPSRHTGIKLIKYPKQEVIIEAEEPAEGGGKVLRFKFMDRDKKQRTGYFNTKSDPYEIIFSPKQNAERRVDEQAAANALAESLVKPRKLAH